MDTLPSVDNLLCFDAAARTLNFRAAARAVALTPAAFGQRIKQLESQLGVRLFERTTRSVRLTAAGLALMPSARTVLDDLRRCSRVVRGEEAPPRVEITLGTRFELGLSWVLPALETLEHAHPHVHLHLYFGSGLDLLRRLRAFEIDCAITSTRVVDPAFDAIALHEERYVFVGASRHLDRVPLTRTAHGERHTLLDIGPELALFRYAKDAPGFPEGLRFAAHRWLGIGAAIRHVVLAGGGVAVLPLYMVEDDLKKGRMRRIFPKLLLLHDSFRLLHRRDDPRVGEFEAMAGTLRTRPIT